MKRLSRDFEVTEHDGIWRLRATPRRIRRIVAMCAFVGLGALLGGWVFDTYTPLSPLDRGLPYHMGTVMGVIGVCLSWGIAAWAWVSAKTYLSVDTHTGAVHFGARLLCPPKSVSAVALRRSLDPDTAEPLSLEFTLRDGAKVFIPSPLLGSLPDAAVSQAIAAELAGKLGVELRRDV